MHIGKNRLFHRFPMQTEKSQPEDKPIMLERGLPRFPALSVNPSVATSFPALSIYPWVGISLSASETDDWLFFLPIIQQNRFISLIFFLTIYSVWRPTPNVIWSFSLRRVSVVYKQLTSLLVSRASCLSPWARL